MIRPPKRPENIIPNEKKNQPVKTDSELTQAFELAKKGIQTVTKLNSV